MNDSKRYQKSVGHLESESSESSVVLLSKGKYYSLEETGAAVWRALTEPRTLGELVAQVQKEYEIDSATAQEDVKSFLGELIEAGLVQEYA